jgi:hypothetical protein
MAGLTRARGGAQEAGKGPTATSTPASSRTTISMEKVGTVGTVGAGRGGVTGGAVSRLVRGVWGSVEAGRAVVRNAMARRAGSAVMAGLPPPQHRCHTAPAMAYGTTLRCAHSLALCSRPLDPRPAHRVGGGGSRNQKRRWGGPPPPFQDGGGPHLEKVALCLTMGKVLGETTGQINHIVHTECWDLF